MYKQIVIPPNPSLIEVVINSRVSPGRSLRIWKQIIVLQNVLVESKGSKVEEAGPTTVLEP